MKLIIAAFLTKTVRNVLFWSHCVFLRVFVCLFVCVSGCVHIRRLSASKMQSLVIDRRSHLKITGNMIHMGDPKRPSTALNHGCQRKSMYSARVSCSSHWASTIQVEVHNNPPKGKTEVSACYVAQAHLSKANYCSCHDVVEKAKKTKHASWTASVASSS